MWKTYFALSQIPLLECISQGQTKRLRRKKPFELQLHHFQSSYRRPIHPICQCQTGLKDNCKMVEVWGREFERRFADLGQLQIKCVFHPLAVL